LIYYLIPNHPFQITEVFESVDVEVSHASIDVDESIFVELSIFDSIPCSLEDVDVFVELEALVFESILILSITSNISSVSALIVVSISDSTFIAESIVVSTLVLMSASIFPLTSQVESKRLFIIFFVSTFVFDSILISASTVVFVSDFDVLELLSEEIFVLAFTLTLLLFEKVDKRVERRTSRIFVD
jgi:hypothetical protein